MTIATLIPLLAVLGSGLDIPIRPLPQTFEARDGAPFVITRSTAVVLPEDADADLVSAARNFIAQTGTRMPLLRGEGPSGEPAIWLNLSRTSILDHGRYVPEAYRLDVDNDGVWLWGSDTAGLRHGLSVVLELLGDGSTVPPLRTVDYPDTPVRGVIADRPLSEAALHELGRTRCNVLIFRIPMDARLDNYAASFAHARMLGAEPIPGMAPNADEWEALRPRALDYAAQLEPKHIYLEIRARSFWGELVSLSEASRRMTRRLMDLHRELPGPVTLLVRFDPMIPLGEVALPEGAFPVVDDPAAWDRPHLLYAHDAQAAYSALHPRADQTLGLWTEYADAPTRTLAVEKAWNARAVYDPWLHGLNGYFGTRFVNPSKEDVLATMVSDLNRRTLDGTTPGSAAREFRRFVEGFARQYPGPAFPVEYLAQLYGNIAEYAEIEARYRETGEWRELSKVATVSEWMGQHFWEWDAERTQYIVDVVMGKRLFVPSSILFGDYVVPYRMRRPPSGNRYYSVPLEARYVDAEHEVDAFFESAVPFGPIVRLDFETVGAAAMLIERSNDGDRWLTVDHLTTKERGGLYPPHFLNEPFWASRVRMQVQAPAETAQLRNASLTALKPDPSAAAGDAGGIVLDGRIGEVAWQRAPDAFGFVTPQGTLDRRPVIAWFAHDTSQLWIAGRVAEWLEGESIDLLFANGNDRFRFSVNGDSSKLFRAARNGDAFEVAIPWSSLGGRPDGRAEWRVDILRMDAQGRVASRWAPGTAAEINGRLRVR